MYKCGIYVRTSKNNIDINNSIDMQEKLIRKYVESKSEMIIYNTYVDNGYSGLDFVRPGFINLMQDIEKNIINCIIIKDLSRLGRDYIQTGMYIQYIFPSKGVRVIAINDRYDSSNVSEVDKYFMIPLRNYINDSYSRDISNKVRSSLYMKMKNGKCVVSKVPYGYKIVKYKEIKYKYKECKDDLNYRIINKISIDNNVKNTIKDIYNLSLQGYSLQAIANYLNKENILTPYEYRIKNNEKYNTPFVKGKNNCSGIEDNMTKKKWYPMMVKRILTDKIYIGILVQGKVKKISYKIKTREYIEPSQRFYKYNNHERIIDEKVYYVVNRLLKYDVRRKKDEVKCGKLSGIIVCGYCGKSMYNKKNGFICDKCREKNINNINKVNIEIQESVISKISKLCVGLLENKEKDIKRNIERQDIVLNIMNIIIYNDKFVKVIIYNE